MNSIFFFCNHMPLSYTVGQGPLSTCSKSCGPGFETLWDFSGHMVRRFMANLNNCIFHNVSIIIRKRQQHLQQIDSCIKG